MARNADQAAESRAGTVPSGPDERPAGGGADGDQARPVHLVFAATPVERAEIDRRLGETGRRGEAIDADGPDLASRLAGRADDPLLTPVGLAWLPPERGGVRRGSVVDLLTLVNPRRPSVRRQRRILDTDPARSRLVVGAPARLSELRDRFATVTGTSPFDVAFGPFVARQGRLALEREERALAGGRYKVPRLVAEEISQSARFSGAVDELARTLGEPASKVMHQATTALEEMVASHGRLAIDVWDQFTGWMARAYELDVDEDRARAGTRARPRSRARVPSEPPLLPGPDGPAPRVGAPRLPAQSHAGRRERCGLADRPDRAPVGDDLHQTQLP